MTTVELIKERIYLPGGRPFPSNENTECLYQVKNKDIDCIPANNGNPIEINVSFSRI